MARGAKLLGHHRSITTATRQKPPPGKNHHHRQKPLPPDKNHHHPAKTTTNRQKHTRCRSSSGGFAPSAGSLQGTHWLAPGAQGRQFPDPHDPWRRAPAPFALSPDTGGVGGVLYTEKTLWWENGVFPPPYRTVFKRADARRRAIFTCAIFFTHAFPHAYPFPRLTFLFSIFSLQHLSQFLYILLGFLGPQF